MAVFVCISGRLLLVLQPVLREEWGSLGGLLEAASVLVEVICWAVESGKCACGCHLLGCWRQQVGLWESFVGLLKAASVLVGAICWAVGGSK